MTLAKQIAEDRKARAMAASTRRRTHIRPEMPRSEEDAEVIELAFGADCEPEQIGV